MPVIDFPEVNPDTGTSLTLVTNTTSFTSELNNATQNARLVGDQWAVNMPFSNRIEREGRKLKAFLSRLGGQTGRFRMGPPDLKQLGTIQGAGVIDGAGQTGSTISTKGWNAEQPELFVEGDYLEVNGELKMVVDEVSTIGGEYIEYTGTNLMPSPFDPSGWTGASDADLSYQSVAEQNPSGESFVGEFEYIGTGTAPINYSTNNDASIGDKYYICLVIKPENGYQLGFRFSFQEGAATYAAGTISAITGEWDVFGSPPINIKTEFLSNGYLLAQIEYISEYNIVNDFDIYTQFYKVSDEGVQITLPAIGDKIKVQAAFFGKTGKYQGAVSYVGTNLMPSPFDPSGWYGNTSEGTDTIENTAVQNPSGEDYIGLATQVGTDQFILATNRYASLMPVIDGETVYASIIVKDNGGVPPMLRFRFADGQGFRGNTYYNVLNNTLGGAGLITDLPNGYKLVQASFVCDRDDPSFYTEIFMWADFENTATPSGAAPIGSQLLVQAAFFGKGDDYPAIIDPADPNQWPANYLAKADINIAPPLRKATNDLDPIEATNPQAIFMLADDNQASWLLDANYIHGVSINCIEDVT